MAHLSKSRWAAIALIAALFVIDIVQLVKINKLSDEVRYAASDATRALNMASSASESVAILDSKLDSEKTHRY